MIFPSVREHDCACRHDRGEKRPNRKGNASLSASRDGATAAGQDGGTARGQDPRGGQDLGALSKKARHKISRADGSGGVNEEPESSGDHLIGTK